MFVVSVCRNIKQFKFNLYSDSSQKVNDLKRFETEMSSQMALLLYTNTTAWQLSYCKKMHCRRVADELHLLWCRLTQVDCNVLAICIHLQIRKQLLAKLSQSKSDWRQLLRITIQPTASHSMSSAVALQSKTVPQRLRVLHMQPLLNQLFFRNYLQIIAEPQFFPFLVSMRLLFCFYSLIYILYIYIILYYILYIYL